MLAELFPAGGTPKRAAPRRPLPPARDCMECAKPCGRHHQANVLCGGCRAELEASRAARSAAMFPARAEREREPQAEPVPFNEFPPGF